MVAVLRAHDHVRAPVAVEVPRVEGKGAQTRAVARDLAPDAVGLREDDQLSGAVPGSGAHTNLPGLTWHSMWRGI